MSVASLASNTVLNALRDFVSSFPWIKVIMLAAVATAASMAKADDRLDHFESKIRPILVKHCLECHGNDPAKLGGGLSLISSSTMIAGGDSGNAIREGKPEESLLLTALRYEDGLEMPPAGKLPRSVIVDFEKWIRDGAIDPRDDSVSTPIDPELARHSITIEEHWAFQPLATPDAISPLPESKDAIDAIVDHHLAKAGLERSRRASPATVLRRLHYDLTGLPPSESLIRSFTSDSSDIAYQRIVDRLLSSDEFGRHWGRHWLDVARYADSNGSDFNATFHHAWRYRDYVIESFDQDKPFDRFITEQIAGDLMSASTNEERSDQLVATGFLMLGPKMLSERDKAKLQMDVVDDQIDTIGRAFMGLTLGCARCHDHKFDPISTSEYYALAGIFRSTVVLEGEMQKYVSDWIETPLPVDERTREDVARFEQAEQNWLAQLKQAEAELKTLKARQAEGDSTIIIDDSLAVQSGNWVKSAYTQPFVGSGYLHDDNRNKGMSSIDFKSQLPAGRYSVALAYTAGPNRSRSTKINLDAGAESRSLTLDQSAGSADKPWNTICELTLDENTHVTVTLSNEGSDGYVIADAVRFSRLPSLRETQDGSDDEILHQNGEAELAAAIDRSRVKLNSIKKSLAELRVDKPAPLPMAMAVRDAKTIEDAFVCVRGDVNLRGQVVARGFLNVCKPKVNETIDNLPTSEAIPTNQSGRLQLAAWICDPDHPLTARVIVNRVWMHLIGEGLVRTVDNFGVLGESPSHPELLDHLAISFLRNGWSIKKLVREIVVSETYRQSTDLHKASLEVDAETVCFGGCTESGYPPNHCETHFWLHRAC